MAESNTFDLGTPEGARAYDQYELQARRNDLISEQRYAAKHPRDKQIGQRMQDSREAIRNYETYIGKQYPSRASSRPQARARGRK